MSKRVLVVLSDGFEDIEAVAPLDIMKRAKFDVSVAGLESTTVKAAYAVTLLADTTLDALEGEFDAIVLPGGQRNAANLAANEKVVDLVRRMNGEGKLVAAICASVGYVLAEAAGILKGRRATGLPAFNAKIGIGGASVSNELVTVDGNIITGMGPGAAIPFGLAIAEYLGAERVVEDLTRTWWIERCPPPVR